MLIKFILQRMQGKKGIKLLRYDDDNKTDDSADD